jgi:hypothetical protein
MKTIAVIGGSKTFHSCLLKILRLTNVEAKFITKYAIKNKNNYDYVVFNSNSSIKDVLINGSYCFVNMDLINFKNSNINVYGNLITYGLGGKNTVTVSSMEDNNSFVYCLQRDVTCGSIALVEPEEVPVNMDFSNDEEIYAAIVGITISLIEQKDISCLSKERKLTIFS